MILKYVFLIGKRRKWLQLLARGENQNHMLILMSRPQNENHMLVLLMLMPLPQNENHMLMLISCWILDHVCSFFK